MATLTTATLVSTAATSIGTIAGPNSTCYIYNDAGAAIMRILIGEGTIGSINYTHEIQSESGWPVPKGFVGPITAQLTAGSARAMVTISNG